MGDFNRSLQRHMQAIIEKDLVSYEDTIHATNITLVLPNGKLIQTRDEFVQFNRDWFADRDWKLSYEVVKTVETSEMSFAVLLIHYDDLDSEGLPYHQDYYLHLVFVNENGHWLLTYDQNTFIT